MMTTATEDPPPSTAASASALAGSTSTELGAFENVDADRPVIPPPSNTLTATAHSSSLAASVAAPSLTATTSLDPNLLSAPSAGPSRPSSPGTAAGGALGSSSASLSRNTSTSTLPSLVALPSSLQPNETDPTSLLLQLDAEIAERHLDRLPPSQRHGAVNEIYAISHASHARTAIEHVEASELPTFVCASCGVQLALQDELISKSFSGRDGKAYLFFSVLNCSQGQKEDRQLLTGMHTVADLSCGGCGRNVGWTYLRAWEGSQKYKEGKFILERAALHKANNWQ